MTVKGYESYYQLITTRDAIAARGNRARALAINDVINAVDATILKAFDPRGAVPAEFQQHIQSLRDAVRQRATSLGIGYADAFQRVLDDMRDTLVRDGIVDGLATLKPNEAAATEQRAALIRLRDSIAAEMEQSDQTGRPAGRSADYYANQVYGRRLPELATVPDPKTYGAASLLASVANPALIQSNRLLFSKEGNPVLDTTTLRSVAEFGQRVSHLDGVFGHNIGIRTPAGSGNTQLVFEPSTDKAADVVSSIDAVLTMSGIDPSKARVELKDGKILLYLDNRHIQQTIDTISRYLPTKRAGLDGITLPPGVVLKAELGGEALPSHVRKPATAEGIGTSTV